MLRAESSRLSSAAIEALADELPADEAQVDSLVKESIDGYFARAFTTTTLAALHRGVPVDALHLVTGARLLPDPGFLGKLSVYMAGDVVGALVGAVADGRLSWQKEAVALFLAAHWSREKGLDTHRAEIVRRTRMCARVASGIEVHAFVAATADVLEDDQLSRLLAQMPSGRILQTARTWSERFLEVALAPVLEGLDDDEDEAGTHATQRRAVERVGRNEPCPCGSGRKYKRCCETKDRERLRDSSDVPGVTRTELRLHLEDHLTGERIHSLRAHDLARLDPKRIDPQLRGMILNRLIQFEEFDALVNYFETMGVARDQMHLLDAVSAALRAGKPDMARTLVKLAPDLGEDWLSFREHLLVKGVVRFPALDLLEAEARRWIDESAVGVACDLLQGPWPSVGILVARGAAPLAEPWDRTMLLQEIGLARDRLELPALDPTEGLEDIWGWGEETEHFTDSSPLAEPAPEARGSGPDDDETQRRLETKEAEVARLRQELSDLHARLDERLSEAARSDVDASPAAEAIPANDPRVAKLKERVDRLRSELSQRHSERNQLRRQLASSLKRVDTLEAERERIGRPPEGEADDDSDSAPVQTPIALSFRVPVFSERFRSSADKVSDPIRRRAVIVASRIAAGDESAFRGTRRLRRDRDLFRQRLGREHRLIFKLHAQELEAVDVVPRKDLERAIRELARH